MSDLLTFRAGVVAGIAARLPALDECTAHGGQFTAAELSRFSARTPSVRVALPDFRSGTGFGRGVRLDRGRGSHRHRR